ncbi:cytochrome P450 [Paraliomyxa miuraensis]|uniref:cytochrome P450 n=1 Tax=Paraliomyxa miuraensis TaxID=376150 RepID=UPI00224DC357|nr:cytochrome P450 [Paraliomyxa miuraensis]MCX4246632.1 cytochrome P450 [Paraliomyxa miuraensis]
MSDDPDATSESERRFATRELSYAEELHYFRLALRNYAEAALLLHRRHGDVVRKRLPRRALWFVHPRHLRRILRTNVRNYPKAGPSGGLYDYLRPILGNGLFVSDGELWTRQRRILAPEFRTATVGRFLPVIVERTQEMLDEWARSVDGEARDISDDMMRLTMWVVGGSMFKSDLRQEAEAIGHALELQLRQSTRQILSAGLLRPWMPTPGNLEARRAARELDALVRGIVTRGRAGDVGEVDVLSRLLVARDGETGEAMSDQQLVDEVKSLILAGHETTSLTLAWTFYLLAHHPEVEARLVEEVTRVLGDRPPRPEDVPELIYTRMVLFEVMRLYPPVPAVPRIAIDDDEFDGVRVRAGENTNVVPFVTHRHPEFWTHPDVFDPQRFHPSRIDAIEPYAYLPFLRGRRACLGEHFAMLEGVVSLAMLVRRFHLEWAEARAMQTRPISTLRFERPLRMRVRAR